MGASAQHVSEAVRLGVPEQRWKTAACIGFRFVFLYFLLYILTTQIITGLLPLPFLDDLPEPGSLAPLRATVMWVGAHVFHVKVTYQMTGSGDKLFDWVLNFCALVAAVLSTAVWSVLDRKRANYTTPHKWFHLFLRFALGSQLLAYGMLKLVPLQMPHPSLTRLLEPFGNFSPMGVLWNSIGASPAYEMFTGAAELSAGILLFFPRTAMLGALLALAAMTEVFALNMTYDVPVKLLSFHLILMSLVLLAPEMGRMARFIFTREAVGPSDEPPLLGSARGNRIALWAQVAFALALVAANGINASTSWRTYGPGAPKSPLYGIWDVEELRRDEQVRPPLLTDQDRWRRVIFDSPKNVSFQRMDERFTGFRAAIDIGAGTIALTKGGDPKWKATLTFQRLAPERMTIAGEMDGHRLEMQLRLVDRGKMLLVSRGFHWIQDVPFNR